MLKKVGVGAIALLFFIIGGCAVQQTAKTDEPDFYPYKFSLKHYAQRVDNFILIVDASGSMTDTCKGEEKYRIAKKISDRLIRTIPDLPLKSALVVLGTGFSNNTKCLYGTAEYKENDFRKAINSITLGGLTPLGDGIDAATIQLATISGETAVIIISDGKESDNNALTAAEHMKEKYRTSVYIHTILIGDDADGKKLLNSIADKNGLSKNANDITDAVNMADFVRSVFLIPNDDDIDGVYDYMDECLGTSKGIKVDNTGCPLDSDGDGVIDNNDRCPNTPKGAGVNKYGCWASQQILFDTGKWNIKSNNLDKIDNVVKILQLNPTINVQIEGHTDIYGGESYNRVLSQKRANEIVNYLISKGIASNRLKAVGYGSKKPVAPNNTEAGRSKNRRIEVKILR